MNEDDRKRAEFSGAQPGAASGLGCMAAERQATARELLQMRAKRLYEEAQHLEALARHISPALDADHQAYRCLLELLNPRR